MNGYSEDNYIIDQDYFSSYQYRTLKADCNGCGPIAIYNQFHYLKMDQTIGSIIEDMNQMYKFKWPGPTTMKVLKEYLHRYYSVVEETRGRLNCIQEMQNCPYGILRYNESNIPHLIFYYQINPESSRFFNVDDGMEDVITSISSFSTRILPGYTSFIFAHN